MGEKKKTIIKHVFRKFLILIAYNSALVSV
jgi:hypothetical protein